MSADALPPLSKVDSAIAGLSSSPVDDKKMSHRRTSSSASNVFNINDLEKEGKDLEIAPETQTLAWKINTSPSTIDDKDVLKKPLCTPMVKKIDLRFPFGLEVTARNLKGVTIKDALDVIYKQFKKKADDELDGKPYLRGFEWDREECYTRFIVHQTPNAEPVRPAGGSSNKKKNKKDKDAPKDAEAAAAA